MKRFWSRICGFVSEHDLFFRLFLILFGCIILPVSIACIAFNWHADRANEQRISHKPFHAA